MKGAMMKFVSPSLSHKSNQEALAYIVNLLFMTLLQSPCYSFRICITTVARCVKRSDRLEGMVTTNGNSKSVVFSESVRKNARDCFEKKGFAGNGHFQGIANFGYLKAI